MIKIITDSSSNITPEESKALGIGLMPLTISFGTQEFRDGIDISCEEFYEKMQTGGEFPHTSQLTEEQVEGSVMEAFENGADEVLLLPLASALSGSYERCKTVAERHDRVYAHDCCCTTVMLKLCVLHALKMANAGAKVHEIIDALKELRPKLKIYACLDTLENLRKGARLSTVTAIIGAVLKIKPVITFSVDGKVEMIGKQFGMNKAIGSVVSAVDKNKIDYDYPVYLIYTQNDKNSDALAGKLGIQYTEKGNICPVIGTHIGVDAAGIVYAEK